MTPYHGTDSRLLASKQVIGLTLLFLGLAFRRLHMLPQVCEPGTACADPRTLLRQRLVFWLVAAAVLGLLAVPWLAPMIV